MNLLCFFSRRRIFVAEDTRAFFYYYERLSNELLRGEGNVDVNRGGEIYGPVQELPLQVGLLG